MMLVPYIDQTKSGIFIQPIPRVRIVCTVTMKFRPVRIVEKPRMKMPKSVGTTADGVCTL